jgi:hypothetical protein
LNSIRATIKDRKLELPAPPDWPDGTEVVIEPSGAPSPKIGLDESEWRGDAEALADWAAWMRTIEPLEFTPEEAARIAAFDERMRRFNIEAVRGPMEQGGPADEAVPA